MGEGATLRASFARFLCTSTLVAVLGAGCGASRRSEPLQGPLQLASEQEKHGRTLFMQHCFKCHPSGEAGLGPSLNDKPLPDMLKRFQVRHGIGTMPAFPENQITDSDLDALMAYLSALRHHEPEPEKAAQAAAQP
jgi:mono/diheme cytochrome c family protein